MERAGGVLEAGRLVGLTSRRKVRTALSRGVIVQEAKVWGGTPCPLHEARRAAHRLSGVRTGRSAAAHYMWPMKTQPARPEIAVPRNRKVGQERRAGRRPALVRHPRHRREGRRAAARSGGDRLRAAAAVRRGARHRRLGCPSRRRHRGGAAAAGGAGAEHGARPGAAGGALRRRSRRQPVRVGAPVDRPGGARTRPRAAGRRRGGGASSGGRTWSTWSGG